MPDIKDTVLPTDSTARKAIPIYSGFMVYFPDAIAAVAELSRIGNDQHNPGKPLHWDRSKSGDEMDALCRHMLDMASGTVVDTDDVLHATKQAWRAMAHLQKTIELSRTRKGFRTYDEYRVAQDHGQRAQDSVGLRACQDCAYCEASTSESPCRECWHSRDKINWVARDA